MADAFIPTATVRGLAREDFGDGARRSSLFCASEVRNAMTRALATRAC